MSRCLYVTRSDPNVDVLKNTAQQILQYSFNLKIKEDKDNQLQDQTKYQKIIKEESDRIGIVYHDFRKGIYESYDVTQFKPNFINS
jgi:archaellin